MRTAVLFLAFVAAASVYVRNPEVDDENMELDAVQAGEKGFYSDDRIEPLELSDDDVDSITEFGPQFSLGQATDIVASSSMVDGGLALADLHDLTTGKVGAEPSKAATRFLELMREGIDKNVLVRRKTNLGYRSAQFAFYYAFFKVRRQIGVLARVILAWTGHHLFWKTILSWRVKRLGMYRQMFKVEQAIFRKKQARLQKMLKDLKDTKTLLLKGYKMTCPSLALGMSLMQKKGSSTVEQNSVMQCINDKPAFLQFVQKMSPEMESQVMANLGPALNSTDRTVIDHQADVDYEKAAMSQNLEDEKSLHLRQEDLNEQEDADDENTQKSTVLDIAEDGEMDGADDAENDAPGRPSDESEYDNYVSLLQTSDLEAMATATCPEKPDCKMTRLIVRGIVYTFDRKIHRVWLRLRWLQIRWQWRARWFSRVISWYQFVISRYKSYIKNAERILAIYGKRRKNQIANMNKVKKKFDSKTRAYASKMKLLTRDICAMAIFRDAAVTKLKLAKVTDCKMTKWKARSMCSHKCGTGLQPFRRWVARAPKNGGIPCPVYTYKKVQCNSHACPVDCLHGMWSSYGKCKKFGSGRQGRAVRYRQNVQPQNGGSQCDVETMQRRCVLPKAKLRCKRRWLRMFNNKSDDDTWIRAQLSAEDTYGLVKKIQKTWAPILGNSDCTPINWIFTQAERAKWFDKGYVHGLYWEKRFQHWRHMPTSCLVAKMWRCGYAGKRMAPITWVQNKYVQARNESNKVFDMKKITPNTWVEKKCDASSKTKHKGYMVSMKYNETKDTSTGKWNATKIDNIQIGCSMPLGVGPAGVGVWRKISMRRKKRRDWLTCKGKSSRGRVHRFICGFRFRYKNKDMSFYEGVEQLRCCSQQTQK